MTAPVSMPSAAENGHGFVNMRDRLGAIGAGLDVESRPGEGTQCQHRIALRQRHCRQCLKRTDRRRSGD